MKAPISQVLNPSRRQAALACDAMGSGLGTAVPRSSSLPTFIQRLPACLTLHEMGAFTGRNPTVTGKGVMRKLE